MAVLTALARWVLVLCLVEAPWAYGSTRPWAAGLLNVLLALSFVLHLPGVLAKRRRYPILPIICLGLLLAEDAWMWWNARSFHDIAFWQFVPLTQPFPGLPGSWDRATTQFHLFSLGAMAGGFFVALDMVRESRWRNRIWWAIAGTGVSVVIYGIVQRLMHAPSIFWLNENTGATFFGPFIYHGNAGAFLNLVWPALAFLLIRSFRRPHTYNARAFWASCLFMVMAGSLVNISRVAAGISILLLVVSLFWIFPRAGFQPPRLLHWKMLVPVVLVGAFITVLAMTGRNTASHQHWRQLPEQLTPDNPRLLVYDACLRTIPEAGWLGFGAGTFSAIFPSHTLYLGDRIQGFWMFAHEDYLQTVLEYGYAGTVVWTVFFFGGIAIAFWRAARALRADETTEHIGYAVCALALLGIALHSLVDFPLQIPAIQLYVMVYLALVWRVSTKLSRHEGGE